MIADGADSFPILSGQERDRVKREWTGKTGQSGDAVSGVGMGRQRGGGVRPMRLLPLHRAVEDYHLSGIDTRGLKKAKPFAVRRDMMEKARIPEWRPY
jgi:hypothetical protein